jgi:hypothetical protein
VVALSSWGMSEDLLQRNKRNVQAFYDLICTSLHA